MNIRTSFVLVPLLIIAGCSGSGISTVKEGHLLKYPQYTIGQAFDNRKVCSRTEWSSFKDDREREIVEYRCYFTGVSNLYHKQIERGLRTLTEAINHVESKSTDNAKLSQLELELNEAKKALSGMENNVQKKGDYRKLHQGYKVTELQNKIKSFKRDEAKHSSRIEKMQAGLSRLEHAQSEEHAEGVEAYEYYHWVVMDDSMEIVAGGIVELAPEIETKDWPYTGPNYPVGLIYSNNAENFTKYLQATFWGRSSTGAGKLYDYPASSLY